MRPPNHRWLLPGAVLAGLLVPGRPGLSAPQRTDLPGSGTPRPEVQELKPPPGMVPGGPPQPPQSPPYPPEEPYDDSYGPPEETPPYPPEVPPAPYKVVEVQFCVLDDGRLFGRNPSKAAATNPGDPDGRFGAVRLARFLDVPNLLLGLLVKNALYAQAGVGFAVAGPTVFIPDPHPNVGPAFAEGGELGDVVEPGDDLRYAYPDSPTSLSISGGALSSATLPVGAVNPDGAGQWAAVRRECLKAVMQRTGQPLAAGTLLEIVIRRFVLGLDSDVDPATGLPSPDGRFDEDTVQDAIDQDGQGGDGEDPIELSNLLGISPRPKCSREPPALERTPTVVDPELLGIGGFGFVLAHENGHALCLDDAPAGARQRVMSPRVPPFVRGFTAREIRLLRAQAQHLSGTRDKTPSGALLERAGPVARYALDDIFELDADEVDLFAAGVAKREDGSLGLLAELARLIPAHARAVYTLSVDLDASPKTGSAYSPAKGAAPPGTDLQVAVTVLPGKDGLATRPTVRIARHGRLVPVEVPGLDVLLAKVFLPRGAGDPIPLHHSLFVVVPQAALPMPPVEGFRMLAESARPDGTAFDRAPVVVGSVTPDWSGPLLIVEPAEAPAGAKVVAYGSGFSPGAEVALYAGVVLLGSATADHGGAFAARLTVPAPSQETGQPLARGAVMPLTALDAQVGSDVAFLIVHP